MADKKYNGWANYPTWRIKLEIFDSPLDIFEDRDEVTAYELEEYAENTITQYDEFSGLAVDYAMAFISDVNWHEISTSINEDLKEAQCK